MSFTIEPKQYKDPEVSCKHVSLMDVYKKYYTNSNPSEFIFMLQLRIKNMKVLTNSNETPFIEIFKELNCILEKLNEIDDINRISNIPTNQLKHELLILIHLWNLLCHYYLYKSWLESLENYFQSMEFNLLYSINDKIRTISGYQNDIIGMVESLRYIEYYYETCNYWKLLKRNARYAIVESAETMFFKVETESITIENYLLKLKSELNYEVDNLKPKLILIRFFNILTSIIIIAFLGCVHYLTLYLNKTYNFNFPDIGTVFICFLANTEIISTKRDCWNVAKIDFKKQFINLFLLWISVAFICHCIYSYIQSYFNLSESHFMESYSRLKSRLNLLCNEYDLLKQYVITTQTL